MSQNTLKLKIDPNWVVFVFFCFKSPYFMVTFLLILIKLYLIKIQKKLNCIFNWKYSYTQSILMTEMWSQFVRCCYLHTQMIGKQSVLLFCDVETHINSSLRDHLPIVSIYFFFVYDVPSGRKDFFSIFINILSCCEQTMMYAHTIVVNQLNQTLGRVRDFFNDCKERTVHWHLLVLSWEMMFKSIPHLE